MGQFFSNVAFYPQVSAEMAHQLAKHAEQMTYRQFCLLNIAKFDNHRPKLREGDYRNQGNFPVELQQILYECLDLYGRGFVNFAGEGCIWSNRHKAASDEGRKVLECIWPRC